MATKEIGSDNAGNLKVTETFYLLFMPSNNWLWMTALKKGFQHILLIKDDGKTTLVIDPNNKKMNIFKLDGKDGKIERFAKKIGARCLFTTKHTTFTPDENKKLLFRIWPTWFNCVNLVQYVIGMNEKVLTPYGLYKRFKNMSDARRERYGFGEINEM